MLGKIFKRFSKRTKISKTNLSSIELIRNAFTNKTLSYPHHERDYLNLRGLLPPVQLTLSQQKEMIREEFDHGLIKIAITNPDPETTKAGVTPEMIRQWKVLQSIQD